MVKGLFILDKPTFSEKGKQLKTGPFYDKINRG